MQKIRFKIGSKYLLYGILGIEIFVSMYAFFLGDKGLIKLPTLKKEQQKTELAISLIHVDIKKLEDSIAQWHQYSFYKEKIAREQLQMAKADDIIYFTGNS